MKDSVENPEAKPGKKFIGRHEVLGEIARGGMGAVIEARDPGLGRDVAVKVLLPESRMDAEAVARFIDEAQIQAQLEHPNICPVHEIGKDKRDSPYFSMKRVRGKPLHEVIDEYHRGGRVTLFHLVAIFMKVCDAVGFAHSKGVIHRDLKPANVMVGDYGEVLVMDWGLARIAGRADRRTERLTVRSDLTEKDSSELLSMDGSVVGTPAYMPPEQAMGDVAKMSERSDIYSLGAILYEILAGSPPFSGGPLEVLGKVVKDGALVPPCERAAAASGAGGTVKTQARQVPRELEAVVLKAMAFKPSARYRTVDDLRSDLEAWTEGRVLRAAEYTLIERAVKWVGRNRVLSAVAGMGAAAALVVGILLLWSSAEKRIAEKVGRDMGARLAKQEHAKSAKAVLNQNLDEARTQIERCRKSFEAAAAARIKTMPVVPAGQSVSYARGVEKGPMAEAGPPGGNVREPDWGSGPQPPPSVDVPVRALGLSALKEATEAGSFAVLFAERAADSAEAEGFDDLKGDCRAALEQAKIAFGRALSASGDPERACKELARAGRDTHEKTRALAYAKGLCMLSVVTNPAGAEVKLFPMPPGSAEAGPEALRKGRTPADWADVPEGVYVLRFAMEGRAPVAYHLRLCRDLPPEAAHEMAVLAEERKDFRLVMAEETKRLSGAAPALRLVFVDLPEAKLVPEGFVVVPAGSFLMGEEQKPVSLETFFAASAETSAGDWMDFLDQAGGRSRGKLGMASVEEAAERIWTLLKGSDSGRVLPAAALSWDDARTYLRWRNSKAGSAGGVMYLLPTEAMWEKAARGADGRTFPWGDDYDRMKINGAELRQMSTQEFLKNYDPVYINRGTSVYGLKHAGGNICEWCLNRDASNTEWRVNKGGCFSLGASMLRLAGRDSGPPELRYSTHGFRVFACPSE